MTLLGAAAFVCFFLADLNDWKIHVSYLTWLFPCGSVLLLITMIFQISLDHRLIHSLLPSILIMILTAGALGMLIRCLFFSFPAADAYVEPGKLRAVFKGKDYAYCRHPGFWWLLFTMIGLTLTAGLPVYALIVYTICNFLLILFEDKWVFPSVLSGYTEYQREVPFLIPSFKVSRG